MSEKVQISLWLEKDLKHIVDNEDLNITRWVNESLRKYFSVSSVEDVDKKISETRSALNILEKKRADLIEKGTAEKREVVFETKTVEELRNSYEARRNSGVQESWDEQWISAPKLMACCRSMGKSPTEILKDLKEWYDGTQKHND